MNWFTKMDIKRYRVIISLWIYVYYILFIPVLTATKSLAEKKAKSLTTLRQLRTYKEIPFDDDGENSDYNRRLRQLRTMLENEPASRKQVMRLIRKVVLRHTCRRMRTDEIVRILREGREDNPQINQDMRALRRTLDERALLCKLRKVKWVPLREGKTSERKNRRKPQTREGTFSEKKGNRKRHRKRSKSRRQLRTLAPDRGDTNCQIAGRFSVVGVIDRLKSDMTERKCWNEILERRYKIIKYFQYIGIILKDNLLYSSSVCYVSRMYSRCSIVGPWK